MKKTIILYKFLFPTEEKEREKEREGRSEPFEIRELTAAAGPL